MTKRYRRAKMLVQRSTNRHLSLAANHDGTSTALDRWSPRGDQRLRSDNACLALPPNRLDTTTNDDVTVSVTSSADDAVVTPVVDEAARMPILQWDQLPAPLFEALITIEDERERITLLLAILTVIGGMLPYVRTFFHRDFHELVLYLFVVGPAASGKSCIAPAKLLALATDSELQRQSNEEMAKYKRDLAEWNRKGKTSGVPPPIEPTRKLLLLPGDSTAPFMIRALCSNDAVIAFETEADTLLTGLRKDIGDISPVLRKAWHGEPISQARVTNGVYVSTERPHFAMVLSGTPNQVTELIKQRENGLASRFCFVPFHGQTAYKDPFDRSQRKHVEKIKDLAPSISELYRFAKCSQERGGILVNLTNEQQRRHNAHYKPIHDERKSDHEAATSARSGHVTVRIASILAVVRAWFERKTLDAEITATDTDYDIALQLGEYLRQSSIEVVNSFLTARSSAVRKGPSQRKDDWLQMIPPTFTTNVAIAHGETCGLPQSTVFNYLSETNLFRRISHGNYERIDSS